MPSTQQTAYDKTNYGVRPTPRSPSQSPPSLLQSSCDSSHSPPQPRTPPPRPNRSRTRYPDLGRVPLHRRGTSGTYEQLEDLLREAGYKETRVFTPETERIPKNEADKATLTTTVTGFLSGFIPANARQSSGYEKPSSPPLSPIPRRLSHQPQDYHHRPFSPSSIEAAVSTPKARPPVRSRNSTPVPSSYEHHRLTHQSSRRTLPNNYHNRSHSSLHQVPQRSSSSKPPQSTTRPPSVDATQPVFHPRPSRASAYLRHMASQSHIPQRPNSTPPIHDTAGPRLEEHLYVRGNGEAEEDPLPPLPRTWLETVARAVMFGGTGAYIGGPAQTSESSSQYLPDAHTGLSTSPALRQARNVIAQSQAQTATAGHEARDLHRTRSGLSDRTNRTRGGYSSANHDSHRTAKSLAPPALTHVGQSRSGRTLGEVRKTQVVCHSAPASRANSQTRASGTSAERENSSTLLRRRSGGKEKGPPPSARGRQLRHQKSKAALGEGVPSLARNMVEGDDIWKRTEKRNLTEPKHKGFLTAWGGHTESGDDFTGPSDAEYTASSEEDGELDLAQMLVPSKRQNSIKSLRKHLDSNGGVAIRPPRTAYGSGNSRTFRRWMGNNTQGKAHEDAFSDEDAGLVWHSRSRRRHGVPDDEADYPAYLDQPTSTRSSSANGNRSGLPSVWNGLGSS